MFITIALIPILRTAAVRLHAGLDVPNARKVHAAPIPKVGGLAMAIGALVPVILVVYGGRFVNAVLIGSFLIVCFGLVDDLRTLGWKAKFAGQIAAALVVIFYGGLHLCNLGSCLPEGVLLPGFLALPLTVLVIVGVTNAINLSDGLDGLAGGTSLLSFLCIGLLCYTGGEFPEKPFILLLCAAAAGAIFGFLRFNTFPASVFMGDTGSQLLGFLAVTLALGVTQLGSTPLSPSVPLLLLGFPVLDTLVVMAERIRSGRSPFSPDKNHFHHKLIRLGLFHTEAVALIYVITAGLSAAAYLLRYHSDWLILLVYGGFSALVVMFLNAVERRGVRLERKGFFDLEVKGRLKTLKERRIPIRVSFALLRWGLPAILCAAALLPAGTPRWGGLAALAVGVGLLLARLFRPQWLGGVLRVSFFLSVPFVLVHAMTQAAPGLDARVLKGFEVSFGLLALLMLFTLWFTERKKGFHTSPTDLLILLVALILPNLPEPLFPGVKTGNLAVQMMACFFAYEVAVGEMRGRIGRFAAGIGACFAVLAARGLLL